MRALRAPARHHQAIRDALARRGVRFSDEVYRAADDVGPWAELPLRPYQDAALWAWQEAGRRGIVVLPTGSGKTRLAIAAMARARRPALALVPTRVLLAQWFREISSAFGGPVGCLGDGERRVEAITVATFESGWRQMDRLGNRFELLIVDEAHHFGSGVRDEVLELCAAPARLGLDRFRRGELRALVSARVLNEGIDVPDADVAIVVGGTQGEREHVQRIGRLLRPQEGKTAVVYELVMRGTSEVAQARRRREGLAPRQPALL